MLREIGLFIIVSMLLATLVLVHLPTRFLFAQETVCGEGFTINKGDLGIVEGAFISRNMRVKLLLEIRVNGFYSNNISDAYLFAIPEKIYRSHLEKTLPYLEKEEVLHLLKNNAVGFAKVRKLPFDRLESDTINLVLEDPLILILYIEGNTTPVAPPPSTPPVMPVPPPGIHYCFIVGTKIVIQNEQLIRATDIAVIGLAIFIVGDLRSEDSWLKKLKSYARKIKPGKPKQE